MLPSLLLSLSLLLSFSFRRSILLPFLVFPSVLRLVFVHFLWSSCSSEQSSIVLSSGIYIRKTLTFNGHVGFFFLDRTFRGILKSKLRFADFGISPTVNFQSKNISSRWRCLSFIKKVYSSWILIIGNYIFTDKITSRTYRCQLFTRNQRQFPSSMMVNDNEKSIIYLFRYASKVVRTEKKPFINSNCIPQVIESCWQK